MDDKGRSVDCHLHALDPGTDLQLSAIYGDIHQPFTLSGSVALDA